MLEKYISWKKYIRLISADKIDKTACRNLLRINGSRDIKSSDNLQSWKLFLTIKLLIKCKREKIKKIRHTVLETDKLSDKSTCRISGGQA